MNYFKHACKCSPNFLGAHYWRYNPWRREVDPGYPKKIKDSWTGIPDNIDSVFEWKKKVYFFKGKHIKKYFNFFIMYYFYNF